MIMPMNAKAVVARARGGTVYVADSNSGASEGGAVPANHEDLTDGEAYTLTLVESEDQTNAARSFWLAGDSTSAVAKLQYLGF